MLNIATNKASEVVVKGAAASGKPLSIYPNKSKPREHAAVGIKGEDTFEIEGYVHERQSDETWESLGFDRNLLENVMKAYQRPSTLQRAIIPIIFDRCDLAVQAKTKVGKTAAYLLPVIKKCRIAKDRSRTQHPLAIIFSPSYDHVDRCYKEALKFIDGNNITLAKLGQNCSSKIKKEDDILISTPEKLLEMIKQGSIVLTTVRFLVFDQCAHLLSDEFKKFIDDAIFHSGSERPRTHQRFFFAKSFDEKELQQVKEFMRNKEKIVSVKQIIVEPIEQEFKVVQSAAKHDAILQFVKSEFENAELDWNSLRRIVIFCESDTDCDQLSRGLGQFSIAAVSLGKNADERLIEQSLVQLREGRIPVICMTDHGKLDVEVDLIVNCAIPHDLEKYLIRNVNAGKIVSFVFPETDAYQLFEIKNAMEEAGQSVPPSLWDALGSLDPANSKKTGLQNGLTEEDDFEIGLGVCARNSDHDQKENTMDIPASSLKSSNQSAKENIEIAAASRNVSASGVAGDMYVTVPVLKLRKDMEENGIEKLVIEKVLDFIKNQAKIQLSALLNSEVNEKEVKGAESPQQKLKVPSSTEATKSPTKDDTDAVLLESIQPPANVSIVQENGNKNPEGPVFVPSLKPDDDDGW